MADLHSNILDVRPSPWGSKFFQFHAVFWKFWQNRMLAPPWMSWLPPNLGEILDPPLFTVKNTAQAQIVRLRIWIFSQIFHIPQLFLISS